MKKIAIYPGTFDPITYGHIDLAKRAVYLFDEVLIAIAASVHKTPMFSLEQRITMINEVFRDIPQVRVVTFSGLLVDLMAEKQASIILRGIRTSGDMEYEFQLATANRWLKPDIETVFLKPNEELAHVSSSIVREIAVMGGDLTAFVPPSVIAAFTAVPKNMEPLPGLDCGGKNKFSLATEGRIAVLPSDSPSRKEVADIKNIGNHNKDKR